MFVRNKRSVGRGGEYEYLQIVRSYREGGKVKQQIIGTLGRRDRLLASGELDGLLKSLASFSEKLRVVEAVRETGLTARQARTWGPALVFGRLWERQGLPDLLKKLAQDRKFEFDVERAAFALALQRLCAPGSDLQGSGWVQTVEAPGLEGLALQHFYRTTAFLAQVRQDLESALYRRDRNLFNQTLDLVFIDTTSLYCYRDIETELRRRGYSRDRRPELPQVVLCVAVDAQGWPIAWEVFPGNTADGVALRQVVELLRKRFEIGRVVVVADRGMISKETLKLLAGHGPRLLTTSWAVSCGAVKRCGRKSWAAAAATIRWRIIWRSRRSVLKTGATWCAATRRRPKKTPRPAKPWWRSSRRPWPGKVKRALWLTGVLPAS